MGWPIYRMAVMANIGYDYIDNLGGHYKIDIGFIYIYCFHWPTQILIYVWYRGRYWN